MLKRLFKEFKYGEKGFTLIELLVVIAILGVLAAVAVPNISKFIGQGKSEANSTEYANVQTAIIAAMADAKVGSITGGTISTSSDLAIVSGKPISGYLSGGATALAKLQGTYTVGTDGSITAVTWAP
jgi:type IV pilus assembly protein PilA